MCGIALNPSVDGLAAEEKEKLADDVLMVVSAHCHQNTTQPGKNTVVVSLTSFGGKHH